MTITTIADIFRQASTIYKAMQDRRITGFGTVIRGEQPLMKKIDRKLVRVKINEELPQDVRHSIYTLLCNAPIDVTHKYGLLLSFLKGVLEIDQNQLDPINFAETLKRNATTLGVLKPEQKTTDPSLWGWLYTKASDTVSAISEDTDFNRDCAALFIEAIKFLSTRNAQLQQSEHVAQLTQDFQKCIVPEADSVTQHHHTREAVADLSSALLHLSGSIEDTGARQQDNAADRSAIDDAQRLVRLDQRTKAIEADIEAETQRESTQRSDGSRGKIMALESRLEVARAEMETLLAELKESKTVAQVKEQLESEVEKLQAQLKTQEAAITLEAEEAKARLKLQISQSESLVRASQLKAEAKAQEAQQLDHKVQEIRQEMALLLSQNQAYENEMMASVKDREALEEQNQELLDHINHMQQLLQQQQSQSLAQEEQIKSLQQFHKDWLFTRAHKDIVTDAAIEKLIALRESQRKIVFYFQQLETLAGSLELTKDSPIPLKDSDWDHLEMAYNQLIIMYTKVNEVYQPLFDPEAYRVFSETSKNLHEANTSALEQIFEIFKPKLIWFIQSQKYAVGNEAKMDQFINTAAALSIEILKRYDDVLGHGCLKVLKIESFYTFVITFGEFCQLNIQLIDDAANKSFDKTYGARIKSENGSDSDPSSLLFTSLDEGEGEDEGEDSESDWDSEADDESRPSTPLSP